MFCQKQVFPPGNVHIEGSRDLICHYITVLSVGGKDWGLLLLKALPR
jgi:hypothetical protein